jgi:hypothetical protein
MPALSIAISQRNILIANRRKQLPLIKSDTKKHSHKKNIKFDSKTILNK